MTTKTMRTRLLASSMISGAAIAAMSATSALAQAATEPATTNVQELVVTGSRIPSKNLTSVSPITTINSQAVKLQGTTNVEDLINNLPQAFADFGQFESNGASGTATVDLRGLGNSRTLVMIDGKRLMPGDPNTPAPDLNFIPPALIDRVEVLTGGASAVYGSDAVAGVVNFIMKKNFEGLQIDAEYSVGEHNNNNAYVRHANIFGHTSASFGFPLLNLPTGSVWAGERYTATITGGVNSPDGKGNVEFYLGYTDIQKVLEAKYDWSTCGLATNTTNASQVYCSGSSNDANGRVTPINGPNHHTYSILRDPAATGFLNRQKAFEYYNFAPLNYIQRPDVRYTAGEFSHYEVAPWLDLYSSFMFMDDHTVAQIAPSGSFSGDTTYLVPCNDPLLSVAQMNTICGKPTQAGYLGPNGVAAVDIGRRDVEGPPRFSDITHLDYRIVFGAKGDLGSGWTYDISGQYGRSVLTTINGGYLLIDHLVNALNVLPNPAVNGVPGVPTGAAVCAAAIPGASGAATAPDCVPWNIWQPGGVTAAALKYLRGDSVSTGFTSQQVVTASVTGDLGQYGFKSPFASDGAGISVGAEYSRDYLQTNFDAPIQQGNLAGFGGSILDTAGSQIAKGVFGELRIPLIQNMPFTKDLTLETGYRYTNYSSGGDTNTYKIGGDWQVVSDLRLRASYERAVRAPNVSELFLPQAPGLVGFVDPCSQSTLAAFGFPPGLPAQACLNTFLHSFPGMTLNQFENGGYVLPGGQVLPALYGNTPTCPVAQCGALAGGNPALVPEVASTYSFGFVFTPTFLRGFTLSVDYFNIKVEKAIISIPATTIVGNCAILANAFDCSLINRNPELLGALFGGSGAGSITLPLINASSLSTRGFDINADYRTRFSDWHLGDWGSLDFNFTGTYVDRLVTVLPDHTAYNCAGLFGETCGTPTPKWRHQLRVSWTTPWNLTLSANWRYIHSTLLDFNTNQQSTEVFEPGQPGGPAKDLNPHDAKIPDFNYFDLAFQYKIRDRYTIRGGVNNVFDRTPPLIDTNSFGISAPPFGNANTYPQVFDPLGRVFFVGLTADF